MQDVENVLNNWVLFAALSASLVAQVLKLLTDYVIHRKINFRILVTTGGMPSSHSALVTALAVGVALSRGWESIEFAMASIFAIIVMYDAAGVRQAAGKQARILNQMIDELFQEHPEFNEQRLKELLGHTPMQVIMGSVLGVIIAWLFAPLGLSG
ncbi:divergent PAP2 family protein [Lyngbya confervoides]|uniref:Divergent PAP2 family protein n=1 Tax=Lyngbya confervoides BDU141951 TaxID=1574623 RepID=A0ABD4T709_9CYAN|nr:divergent PAP2 family protein [Lyngbya confervoides]MCM1984263.1 divergent PAP2 family protein [Lyngbya confervoides BDU141951]